MRLLRFFYLLPIRVEIAVMKTKVRILRKKIEWLRGQNRQLEERLKEYE